MASAIRPRRIPLLMAISLFHCSSCPADHLCNNYNKNVVHLTEIAK